MIDTQPQYIKLNISGEISIIVVQTHSGRKRDIYAHKRTYTYSHIYEGGNEREHIYIYQVIHHQSASMWGKFSKTDRKKTIWLKAYH